jgi:PAS domain S-box-containing protein
MHEPRSAPPDPAASGRDPGQDPTVPAEVLDAVEDAFLALRFDWTIAALNATAAAWTGTAREDLIGHDVRVRFPEILGTEYERAYRRALVERVGSSFEIASPVHGRWLEVRVFPIPQGLAALARDVSQRRVADAALREAHARDAAALDLMADAVVCIDRAWRVTGVNRTAEAWWRIPREDVLGRVFWEKFPQLAGTEYETTFRRTLDGRQTAALETFSPLSQRWVEIHTFPTPEGMVAYGRDLSERRGAAQELALLADSVPALISFVDPEERYRFVNSRYTEWFGLSHDEVIGRTLREVLGDAAYANVRDHVRQALGGTEAAFDGWLPYRSGGARYVHARYVPRLAADGSVLGYYGLVTDETPRKLAEDRAGRERQRLIDVLENLEDVFFLLGRDGEILYANRACLRYSGRTLDELTGRSLSALYPGFGGPEFAASIERAAREGAATHGEFRGPASGRTFEYTAYPLGDGVAISARDVTDRRAAERRIACEHQVSRLLVESASLEEVARDVLAAVVEAAGGRIGTLWLPRGERLRCQAVQVAEPEAGDAAFLEQCRSLELRRGESLPGRVWHTGRPAIVELHTLSGFSRADAATRAGLSVAVGFPVAARGEFLGVIEVFSNVALSEPDALLRTLTTVGHDLAQFVRRRRAEQELLRINAALQRSNADLEQFAYASSHDLQEPLRMVSLYTQLLQFRYAGRLDPEADDHIARAVAGARRMEQMLKDLLTYSQAGLGAEEVAEPADPSDAVSAAMENLEAAVAESGATVEVSGVPLLRVQKVHLVQLFQNLIGNAIKYRGAEPPRVRVSGRAEDDRVIVEIKDNGMGFEPRYAMQVFGVFKRLHGDGYEGTGIGLAVCSRIVERYGGTIDVDAAPGRGATFRLNLPRWTG